MHETKVFLIWRECLKMQPNGLAKLSDEWNMIMSTVLQIMLRSRLNYLMWLL